MKSKETIIKVPFHDVDSMSIVWHGSYVKYLEVARCELLETFNYSYDAMKESGYAWPIVDMRIKYVKPIVFNQKVKVVSTLVDWEYFLKIDYKILSLETGECLTKAYTKQVAIDMQTEEMCMECPAILLDRINGH